MSGGFQILLAIGGALLLLGIVYLTFKGPPPPQ